MAKHKIKAEEKDTLTVIIPAAGEGRRMKSYGPKSLIELGKSKNGFFN
jgi:2-C-methyl-D-erythritol 4-phosphate cytidylyltransferase